LARLAGAFYLPAFVLGPFSLVFVRATLITPGDPAATADRIAADGWLLRAGSLAELYLALAMLGWAATSQPLLLLPAVPAELALCLWLLVKGVRS
jgi:hypothetical protein